MPFVGLQAVQAQEQFYLFPLQKINNYDYVSLGSA
jgi:hypothetical protein